MRLWIYAAEIQAPSQSELAPEPREACLAFVMLRTGSGGIEMKDHIVHIDRMRQLIQLLDHPLQRDIGQPCLILNIAAADIRVIPRKPNLAHRCRNAGEPRLFIPRDWIEIGPTPADGEPPP